MVKKYVVSLSAEEKALLENMLRSGTERVPKMTHARILLRANDGWVVEDIQYALDVSIPTIQRVRTRFVEQSFEAALHPRQPDESLNVCWTEFKRPIWLPWHAVRCLLVIGAGACDCWRRKWYGWSTWMCFPTKRFTVS